MDPKDLVRISKYLSKHLRHSPKHIGLELARDGWIAVDELLAACNRSGKHIGRAELEEVVARNDKQRFSFDESGNRIRANQGHSIDIDLGLEAVTPPPQLYHGTAQQTVEAILRNGLVKMRRHHVHLSVDVETAVRVGQRHGRPVVLVVDAAAMQQAGFAFYRSDNSVWLADSVPIEYLSLQLNDA